jgi:hypothetical protein
MILLQKPQRFRAALLAGSLALPLLVCGCRNHLVFTTSTKFGLDISQKANQTVDVTMGYQRAEFASVPVPQDTDATATTDAYSVLGRFNVRYNPGISPTNPTNGLHLKQFFATGMAARAAARNPDMQGAFAEAAGQVIEKQANEAKK